MTAEQTTDVEHGLSDRDREILAFEHRWWKYPGAKASAISDRFGVTEVRYYQLLNAIIDHPAALEADPLTVRRLQRVREQRRMQRSLPRG